MSENKNEVSKFNKYVLFFITGVSSMVFLMFYIYGPVNPEPFQKDYWIITLCILSVFLVLVHLFYVVFNYEAWKEKRNTNIAKNVNKRKKMIVDHPDLVSDLIKNNYLFGNLKEDNQKLLTSLDLKSHIDESRVNWLSLKDKLLEAKTASELIDGIKDTAFKQEMQGILSLRDKIATYDLIFEKLQKCISEMLKCNGLSLDLHIVRDKAGGITLDNLINVNAALNRVTEEYTSTTKTLNSSLNDIQKAQDTISASATELISNTDQLKNDCMELKDQIEKIKEEISAKEKTIKDQQSDLDKNAKIIQELNAIVGRMPVKKAFILDKLKSWFKI
jgi:methyl-accepting chemotaxis protein